MSQFRIIVIDGKQASTPVYVRLRQWLKIGLRGFSLKCVEIVEVTAEQKDNDNAEKSSQ